MQRFSQEVPEREKALALAVQAAGYGQGEAVIRLLKVYVYNASSANSKFIKTAVDCVAVLKAASH